MDMENYIPLEEKFTKDFENKASNMVMEVFLRTENSCGVSGMKENL